MLRPVIDYFGHLFLALNRLINTIFGGHSAETISLRSAKGWSRGEPMGCILCKFLDFFSSEHCRMVGWQHGIEDMPEAENMHISDLVPHTVEEGVEFFVAFFGGAALATFIWWLTS